MEKESEKIEPSALKLIIHKITIKNKDVDEI